jgi:ribonuclease E
MPHGTPIIRPPYMENQEYKSKWDDLARDLGANISPGAETQDQSPPPPQAASQPTSKPAATPPAAPPKRSAADWNKLAGDLGIAPVEPIEPEPIVSKSPRATQPPPPLPKAEIDLPVREASEAEDRPKRPERPERQRDERGRGRQTSSRSRGDRSSREEGPKPAGEAQRPRSRRDRSDRDRSERGRPREREVSERREIAPENRERRNTPPPERQVAAPPPEREEPPKPAAVSLWHKIFGAPAEPAAPLEEKTYPSFDPDERPNESGRREGFESARRPAENELSGDDFIDELERDDSPATAGDDASTEEEKRTRPRRRRRGGRGRKASDRPARPPRDKTADDESPADAAVDNDDFGGIESLRGNDDEDNLNADDEFLGNGDADGDLDADALPNRRRAERAIPSWDEAIGFIVDSNLQTRSQRRPPSRSQSRSDQPRGRSRGRRKP